ncbi:hypothetical protein LEP1GSC172_3727 [Leptospira noguchii]|uniref:Uncharacterized protein n=2 Tax=Leptospira noguchii TaxID=28182 RepID=T0GVC1_9LEPT|nr:hypothetical protein LEP1GSC172_3727 [Leptospira noguchii]EQA71286.1 hypothetical protein LEP1GSC059_2571 [Leptospira noguchii serovar Panama str. CZ214]
MSKNVSKLIFNSRLSKSFPSLTHNQRIHNSIFIILELLKNW